MQHDDPELSHVIRWLEKGERPPSSHVGLKSPAVRHFWIYWHNLELKNGLLCRRYHKQDGTGSYLQFVVPKSIRDEVLKQMHDCVLSGHLGRKKTEQKLLQRFYWFEVRDDIRLWITRCETCQTTKLPKNKGKSALGSLSVGAPLDRLSMDILGPLPQTPRGNNYILVVNDCFTKWVEVFAVPDETAPTCARVILNEVICRYGCPLDLHTDQGRNFESHIFKELCDLLQIRKTRSSPRNPKGNGVTERFNSTLLAMIRAYINGQQRNWDLNLGCLAGAYRATPSESTGLTPNMMMLGREVAMAHEVVHGSRLTNKYESASMAGEYVINLRNQLQKSHEIARKHLEKEAERRKVRYDVNIRHNNFAIADLVWLINETREVGVSQKLQPTFLGPYVILAKYGVSNFKIQLDNQGKSRVVHHDKLKRYTGVNPPKWTNKIINKLTQHKTNAKCHQASQTE